MNQFINEPITVIGGGTWGTVVGNLIANNGHKVKLWARDPFVVHSISTRSFNERFLPNLRLHENLIALDDPREALANTKIIIWAIPVQFTRERVRDFKNFFEPQSIVVNLSKGLEGGTLYRPSQIFFEEYQYFKAVGSLGGPNIASEIALEQHTNATVAFSNHSEILGVEEIFNNDFFRVKLSSDLVALEIAGALKNTVAIAAGICDGLGAGANTKASIITKAINELVILGSSLGANAESFTNAFALGDLLATCYSADSRNRRLGYALGCGMNLQNAINSLNGRVSEGISTTSACCELAKKNNLKLPLFNLIENVINQKTTISNFISFALK